MASIGAAPASWQDVIHDTAVQFMTARVCFYETVEGDPYDPETGEGGPTTNLIWAGKGRVQHLNSPRRFATDYQVNNSHVFQWQIDQNDNPPAFIASGTKARVLDGARDSALEQLVFVVDSAINSSDMAVRTVMLTTTMKPVEWTWSE